MTTATAMPTDGREPESPTRGALGHLRQGRAGAAARGVAWTLVNVLASTGITTLVFVVTSRVLAPGDFGLVALAAGLAGAASCLVPLGFGEGLVQRAELEDGHVEAVFRLCAALGVAAYLLLLLASPFLAGWFDMAALPAVVAVVGLRILFDSLAVVPGALLARRMNYRAFAVRTAVANGLGGILCLLLVWAGQGFWALALSQVASSGLGLAVLAATSGWRPGAARASRAQLRDLARFGLSASGMRAVSEARLDQIALGAIAGPGPLGLYFFARRLFQMVNDLTVGVFTPVTGVLFASLQGEPAKAREAFLLAGFAATLAGLPLFGGLIAVADTAVPTVFGPGWEGAVPAVRGFAAIGLMAVIGIVQATLINGRGHAGWWLAYQGTSQLLSAPIVLVAYPLGGLDLAMALLVARTVLMWPLSVRKTLRLLDLPLATYLRSVAAPLAATLAMVGALAVLDRAAPGLEGWPRLGVELALGALTYILALGALAHRRLRQLAALARRR
jgi:teichuronic acid exporter